MTPVDTIAASDIAASVRATLRRCTDDSLAARFISRSGIHPAGHGGLQFGEPHLLANARPRPGEITHGIARSLDNGTVDPRVSPVVLDVVAKFFDGVAVRIKREID